MRELLSLYDLSGHPNIVPLFEVLRENDGSVFFVFEYMRTGSMYEVLVQRRKHKLGPLPDLEIRCMLQQVLQGLKHLHEAGLVHRDMKPENILLNGRICKVADFSLAKEIISQTTGVSLNNPMTSYVSTRWYRAPEVLLIDKWYSFPVDLFAMGCIAAEVYKLQPLFPGADECGQMKLIFAMTGTPAMVGWKEGAKLLQQLDVDFDRFMEQMNEPKTRQSPACLLRKWLHHEKSVHNHVDDTVLDFILGLLALDPNKRLTAQQALDHSYFHGIDARHFVESLQKATESKNFSIDEQSLDASNVNPEAKLFNSGDSLSASSSGCTTPSRSIKLQTKTASNKKKKPKNIVTVSPVPRQYQNHRQSVVRSSPEKKKANKSKRTTRMKTQDEHSPMNAVVINPYINPKKKQRG